MAKYKREKQRIISHMKENDKDKMTTREMIEVLSFTKKGKPSSLAPPINRFSQSLARDRRFIKLGNTGSVSRNDGMGSYRVMEWGIVEWA